MNPDTDKATGTVLMVHSDTDEPAAWCSDGRANLSDRLYGFDLPCGVWKYLDQAESCKLALCGDPDIIMGALREAATICDREMHGMCGCGLLYGKYGKSDVLGQEP